MKTLAYIVLGLSTAAVMFTGSYLAHLGDRSGVGTSAVVFEPADETELGRQLDCERRIVLSRLAAKLDIARAVIQRRLSLLEAAYQMRELVINDSRSLRWIREMFRGCTDEEVFCRHLIAMVQSELLLEPPTAAAEVARLEAELKEHLRRGTLHFPNDSPGPILFQVY